MGTIIICSLIAFFVGTGFGLWLGFLRYKILDEQFLQSINAYQAALNKHREAFNEQNRLAVTLKLNANTLGNEVMRLERELGIEKNSFRVVSELLTDAKKEIAGLNLEFDTMLNRYSEVKAANEKLKQEIQVHLDRHLKHSFEIHQLHATIKEVKDIWEAHKNQLKK